MSDNEVAVQPENTGIATPDALKDAFGDYTGSDYERGGASYPYLIILQSDKTFENFVDGDTITKALYGKVFIRSANKNHTDDLRDSIKGSVIKEQKGAELWVNGQCLFTANHFVDAGTKSELAIQHQCKPEDVKNVIKILLKLDPSEDLYNGEVHQYAIVTIKGASFMPYNDQVKEKQQELFVGSEQFRSMKISNVNKVPTVFWKLELSSKLVDDKQNKRQYYTFDFKVSENSTDVAFKLKDAMLEAANFDLISMKPIGQNAPRTDNKVIVAAGEVMEDPRSDEEIQASTDEVDPAYLPF